MAVEEEEEELKRMINSASVLRSETLDLSKKRIYEVPQEILSLKHLESLHLEGNYITELPEEFFEKLTSLKWLDLRNNRLCSLPVSVGRHRSLRSLLLEGNSLTHLPCELGMAKSLCGLHLSCNPLEFPPPYIVKKGTQEILKYLREMCEKSDQWPEEKYGESVPSDEESEDMVLTSGLDYPDGPHPGQSAGSERSTADDNPRRVSAFKLPPIVRNATIVRRTNTDVSDERDLVQGQTVTKFEPIRRSTWDASSVEASPRKRRSKRKEQDGGFLESVSRKEDFADVMLEEAPSRDEKISETFQKIKIKKKRSPKRAKNLAERDAMNNNLPPLNQEDVVPHVEHVEDVAEMNARFSVLVGDMVAIKVADKHFIKGQPCVGKVVAEVDDRGLVLVHYYVGSYDGAFRPMMSRSSPYLRKVPLGNILCKFEMQTDGRLSPKTAIRVRQMVERPG